MLWLIPLLIAASPVDPQFRAAATDLAQGRFAEAAAGFVAVADSDPTSSVADDALMRAAEIYDERLGDPQRARDLYERVIASYPRSRLAHRARLRAERLRVGLGPEGKWASVLRDYEAIRRDSRQSDPLAALAAVDRMQRLLAANSGFPRTAEAKLWIGNAYAREGRLKESERWYRKAASEHPGSEAAWRALKAEGDSLLARGEYEESERVFRQLATVDEKSASLFAENALDRVEVAWRRARVSRWAWVVIALFVIAMILATRAVTASWADTARAFARPPTEAIYLVFPAALLAMAAEFGNFLVAHAVLMILAGGIAVTWLSGSALDAARSHGQSIGVARGLGHAAACAVTIGAIVWNALVRERVFDLLVQTW